MALNSYKILKYLFALFTHQQEGADPVQVVGGYGTVDIVVIITDTGSDADITDNEVITFPGQGADHTLITLAGIFQIRCIQQTFADRFAQGGNIQAAAGILQLVGRIIAPVDYLIPSAVFRLECKQRF